MAKLAEQYVVEMLNRDRFATIQGVRQGVHEWDILAIRVSTGVIEARHLEVQVSYDPVSYLSNRNARQRSDDELRTEMGAWMEKKFTGQKVAAVRGGFYTGQWKYELVHGELADQRELHYLNLAGVTTHYFPALVQQLCATHPRQAPFVAAGKDAVEIVRNLLCVQAFRPPDISPSPPTVPSSRSGI